MQPKVSVILPVYNAQKYLREAIDSILNQTFKDFEFIIINDGSRDSSPEIIKSYSDERIRYYDNDGNKGLIYTLNRGIDLAKGEYIARMDADDISMPTRFEKQVAYMDSHPDCIVCGTDTQSFYNDKIKDFIIKLLPSHYKYDDCTIKKYLLISACFAHPTVFIRTKTLIDNNIRYKEEYKHAEDYKLWIDLCDYGNFHNLHEKLLKYRITPTQITKNRETVVELKSTAKKCRKEYIEKYFRYNSEIPKIIFRQKLDTSSIKMLKKKITDKEELKNLSYDVYCSLSNYTLKGFLYFLFSLDVIRVNVVYARTIIKRFVSKNSKERML